MRYYVTLEPGQDPVAVDVQDLPSGALDVRIDSRLAEVDVVAVGGALSVRVGGRVVDLTIEGAPPDLGIVAGDVRTYVRVESERQRAAAAAKRGGRGAGDKVALAPMPGRVVRVLVQPGDGIEAGQPLAVMEAMKMENEIRAKSKGAVAAVHVSVGDTVESGAKLVTLA